MGGWCSKSMCCRHCCKDSKNVEINRPFTALDGGSPPVEEKKYSWDNRNKLNLEKLKVEDQGDVQVVRKPGEINGEQFIIRNCCKTKIYLLDFISCLTIDDCKECLIVSGPVSGSVFLRDSLDCTLVSASSQLRLRDCRNINLYTACESQPIIESSVEIITAPYFLSYKAIEDNFQSAKLSWWKSTNWSDIYDYTPNSQFPNWRRYNEKLHTPVKFICPPLPMNLFTDLQLSVNKSSSFVPVTDPIKPDELNWQKQVKSFPFGIQKDTGTMSPHQSAPIRDFCNSIINDNGLTTRLHALQVSSGGLLKDHRILVIYYTKS